MRRWQTVCALDDIVPDTGVCARLGDRRIALFRVGERVYALDDADPFSGASVMSRGIIGDAEGVLKVVSPMYKQAFALETGCCLDDPSVVLATYPARVRGGRVELELELDVD